MEFDRCVAAEAMRQMTAPNAGVKPPRNALIGSRSGYAHRSLARSPYCGVGLNDLLGARYAAGAYEATARSDVA